MQPAAAQFLRLPLCLHPYLSLRLGETHYFISNGAPCADARTWKSSHLMQRDCYHSDAVSNCSVYFLPRGGRKFTRPKIVGPRISKEERGTERERERGEAYLFIHALKNSKSDSLVDKHRCLN